MQKLLSNLTLRQKITILVVALFAGCGIYGLVQWRQEADFRPLFTGLSPEDAAGIVQKLKESGSPYRVTEGGGAVLAPSARVAELRIAMAGAGLPKSGRAGFELFDKANLGTTEFAEHINYQRALEGELERSVMSLAEVGQARVHLTFPKDSVFIDERQPAKASVLVRLKPGALLKPPHVLAINHLVASAVEGLSPEAVSVLDMNGNLLGRPRATSSLDDSEPSDAALDYRHKVEAGVLGKINSTLEPLLGAERFRAGVSAECDFSGGEQSEEIFDPARSVMVNSQRTEDTTGAANSSGVPGTTSTLPRPASRPGSGSTRTSRMTENITYQSSRTVKKTHLPAGSVRRLSIAVLMDQSVTWEKDKNSYRRVLTPPSPEKLQVIRELIAGVTGLNTERGDQLVVETLPFETTLLTEPPKAPEPGGPSTSFPARLPFKADPKLVLGGVAAALLLGLVLGVLLRRRGPRKAAVSGGPAALPAGEPPAATAIAAHPGSAEQQLQAKLVEREEMQKRLDAEALNALKLAPAVTKTTEVLAKHLREKVKNEPGVSAHVLQSWIREDGN